ncbi:uncharacterized protein LOC117182375 [Belonocnema kinseyi]|uniref:uncharacterized protein LOC117182375 n=1 Tax=Belonocnema kinseyi TaxID=2817044 RepID=UPI00143D7312|nr:uncharacterized protein LOC117182375 [Belonocnema kinseyi]
MDMKKKVASDHAEFTFTYLQKKLNDIILPNAYWGYTEGNENFFGLQKIEDDFTIRKRIAVFPGIRINVYFDDVIMPFSEFLSIDSLDKFTALLKKIDEIPI